MGTEPVTVSVATDCEDHRQHMHSERPVITNDGQQWESNRYEMPFPQCWGISVPPGQCREFVLVPASEYKPTAELSPVAKLIVDAALRIESQHRIGSVAALSEAACIVEKAIAAARKIEGGADGDV